MSNENWTHIAKVKWKKNQNDKIKYNRHFTGVGEIRNLKLRHRNNKNKSRCLRKKSALEA